jgi:amidohydrolase
MKEKIRETIRANLAGLFEISRYLYEHPETGNEEHLAAKLLTEELAARGFRVERGICGLDTAFRAVCGGGGADGASVAFFCEYDALPGIGHGCGHNLIAAMSLGAGLGLQSVLDETGGSVLVFGTPAEETDGAKIRMAKEGVFRGITAGIMTHPSALTRESGPSLAMQSLCFQFRGKAAHAAAAPEKGINALDAVILLFNAINALRQHAPKGVMFHGIISEGGEAPNIVPAFAEARFYVRAANKNMLAEAVARAKECAHGAARMTGASVSIGSFEGEDAFDDMLTNRALAAVYNRHLRTLGESEILPAGDNVGSIDMGNVSRVIPAVHGWLGFGDESLVLHTKEFADRTITEKAREMILVGATAMALTGCDVLVSEELRRRIAEEFAAVRG